MYIGHWVHLQYPPPISQGHTRPYAPATTAPDTDSPTTPIARCTHGWIGTFTHGIDTDPLQCLAYPRSIHALPRSTGVVTIGEEGINKMPPAVITGVKSDFNRGQEGLCLDLVSSVA